VSSPASSGTSGVRARSAWPWVVNTRREYTRGIGRQHPAPGDRLAVPDTGATSPAPNTSRKRSSAKLSVPAVPRQLAGRIRRAERVRTATSTTPRPATATSNGVNLVYRPIQDIAFKTSLNTSFRAPTWPRTSRPCPQTFQNGFVDPCATLNIRRPRTPKSAPTVSPTVTALAAGQGLSVRLRRLHADERRRLQPELRRRHRRRERSEQPEPVANLGKLHLLDGDQARASSELQPGAQTTEIHIDARDIASVSAQAAANNCVSGSSLNTSACNTIFPQQRDHPVRHGRAGR